MVSRSRRCPLGTPDSPNDGVEEWADGMDGATRAGAPLSRAHAFTELGTELLRRPRPDGGREGWGMNWRRPRIGGTGIKGAGVVDVAGRAGERARQVATQRGGAQTNRAVVERWPGFGDDPPTTAPVGVCTRVVIGGSPDVCREVSKRGSGSRPRSVREGTKPDITS